MTKYPDNSDIYARKAEGRRDLARLPYGEKLRRVESMRDDLAGLRAAREAKQAEKMAAISVRCKVG